MVTVVPFSPNHVEPAAELVARRVHVARSHEPLIPSTLEDPKRVAGLLARLPDQGLGVAAMDGGRLAGFLGAVGIELWGGLGAYVPEWGHAASDPDVITALHEAASRRWLADRRTVHTVTLWADDVGGEAAWHGLGFGRAVIDTVRELLPLDGGEVLVRRADTGDAPAVALLERALWEHLAGPPTCRVHPEPAGEAATEDRLRGGDRPVWLAMDDSRPLGYLSMEPHEVYPIALAAPHVVRCDGAFVAPDARRRGIGAALLEAGLRWASESGFGLCAVDYESANREAGRFWPTVGCRAVLHSVARRIPDRADLS
jgi:GNAT superfamily N-acetyltransferase